VKFTHALASFGLVVTLYPAGRALQEARAHDLLGGGGRNRRPILTTDLPVPLEVRPGQEVVFTIRAVDPDGDRVTIAHLGAVEGLELGPIRATPEFRVRWKVPENVPARPRLAFRASDGHGTGGTTDLVAQFVRRGREDVTILTEDVTGDGITDVVAAALLADVGGVSNVGAIHVWAGSSTPSGTPTATLTVPGAAAGDRLGLAGPQGIALLDVTGDGIADVVAGAERADVGGHVDAGAIYVFRGGATLTGAVTPYATLTVLGATDGDRLGNGGLYFADVTGDGQTDLVASAPDADEGGVPNVGAVYLWEGGAGLVGALLPTTTMLHSSAVAGDRMGSSAGEGVLLVDVTADAVADVIVGASEADHDGVTNSGALYLFLGGPALGALAEPTVVLIRGPDAQPGDRLGQVSGQGIFAADVTGDGLRDIVAGAEYADDLAVDSGLICVWRGQVGLPSSSADGLLEASSPAAGDRLGHGAGNGIQLVEVTGDTTLDVVATAELADDPFGGLADVGVIYVWRGGPGLASPVAQDFLLHAFGESGDRMGFASGQGVVVADVSGDGRPEIIAGAALADDGFSLPDVGRVYLWDGFLFAIGGGGTYSVSSILQVSATAGDRLGDAAGQGIQTGDVTGDGILDLVVGCQYRDAGTIDQGAVVVWQGGASILSSPSPWADLTAASSEDGDRLGFAEDQGVHLVDVTGDGIRDVVAVAQLANGSGVVDSGSVHVWAGGPTPGSEQRLESSSLQTSARLGSGGVTFADLDDDGITDLLVGSRHLEVSATGSGAVLFWYGSPFLSSIEDLQLSNPLAEPGDQLGLASVGMQVVDLTDDGVPDLLVGAQLADPGGVTNAGALYLWDGKPLLDVHPSVFFTNPSAVAGDRLGAP
jgi:hypothetical protein